MKLLIDTQALIWFIENDKRLPFSVKSLMEDAESLMISIASLWERTIKVSLGKLSLSQDLSLFINALIFSGFDILPIKISHLITLNSLQYVHRDPFDRLIIAQAIKEHVSVISSDSIFKEYPVKIIW